MDLRLYFRPSHGDNLAYPKGPLSATIPRRAIAHTKPHSHVLSRHQCAVVSSIDTVAWEGHFNCQWLTQHLLKCLASKAAIYNATNIWHRYICLCRVHYVNYYSLEFLTFTCKCLFCKYPQASLFAVNLSYNSMHIIPTVTSTFQSCIDHNGIHFGREEVALSI